MSKIISQKNISDVDGDKEITVFKSGVIGELLSNPTPAWIAKNRSSKIEQEILDWVMIKSKRNALLKNADGLVIRHRDQIDNSEKTSLTGIQYKKLLNYKKLLRDLPKTYSKSIDVILPTVPPFIK